MEGSSHVLIKDTILIFAVGTKERKTWKPSVRTPGLWDNLVAKFGTSFHTEVLVWLFKCLTSYMCVIIIFRYLFKKTNQFYIGTSNIKVKQYTYELTVPSQHVTALLRRCYSCRSRGDLGTCKDPFTLNLTLAEQERGVEAVPCASGWCGKFLEGGNSFKDDGENCH
jgi:hypothetical protein